VESLNALALDPQKEGENALEMAQKKAQKAEKKG